MRRPAVALLSITTQMQMDQPDMVTNHRWDGSCPMLQLLDVELGLLGRGHQHWAWRAEQRRLIHYEYSAEAQRQMSTTNMSCSYKPPRCTFPDNDHENKPPLWLCLHILVSTAGGTRIIVGVVFSPSMISFFSSLLDLRLHLDLDLSTLHVHILRFSLGMNRARKGGSSGFLRSGLTLWAFLFFDT